MTYMHNINIWHPFPRRMDSVTNVYTFASSSLGHAQHLRMQTQNSQVCLELSLLSKGQ